MRVDGMEVEISRDQEDHRLDSIDAIETASAPLGSLEQSVNGFQKPVGLARCNSKGSFK